MSQLNRLWRHLSEQVMGRKSSIRALVVPPESPISAEAASAAVRNSDLREQGQADVGRALDAPSISSNWRAASWTGYGVVAFAFIGLGGWSSIAQINSAVVAQGIVSAESSRKTIQHLEGGIIQDIKVRDGDSVEQGQILYQLDQTQARTNLELFVNQRAAFVAREARLVAERDDASQVSFPYEVLKKSESLIVKRAIDDERANFNQRRATLQSQIAILSSKALETQRQIEGLRADREANVQQTGHIDAELVGVRSLYAKNLVALSRLKALEREKSRLEGAVGRTESDIARSEQALLGIRAEKWQAQQQFQQTVTNDIVDVRRQLGEVNERLLVAEDQLKRTTIRAPQAGTVQGMKFFTTGGVIRPGDNVLDIAPLNEELVIRVKISPIDADAVTSGLESEVTFPSFHTKTIPVMLGKLKSVSRDQVKDEKGDAFFAGEVRVDHTTVPDDIRTKLVAGMPSEVYIATGSRTLLQYLVAPLARATRRAMKDKD
ncbi:HlyD family type I secretion periplasmic adaptor subunit [Methylobacterium sp. WL103]|uniref:HlyD family type I secretion periplasmic adaptor subunit n=1 Tax=Methylobacterium sp. WL103 TaxID=2603891 RepID=UPI00164FE60B|nr:HlyD family type I secretion periplasmic adaptor subunit [Methylobacterium sp. WL103]